jgi:Ca2+-binding EF-hand superfamily protein
VRHARLSLKLAAAAWVGAMLVAPTPGQDKPKKEKPPKEKPLASKDEQIIFAAAKRTFAVETERDRWLKVMDSQFPGVTAADGRGEVDFNRWFDAVSQGQPAWALPGIRDKSVKELYLRTAQRLEVGKQQPITREMFLAYAGQSLTAGNSPPWKTPKVEADPFDDAAKIFTMLDRNKSGALEPAETPESLKAAAGQFDANGNGVLEYDEYREYFRARMTGYRDNPTVLSAGLPTAPPPEERPEAVPPPKKEPPASVPAWFRELDEDRDGQVGLYEWRAVGQRPLEEFAEVDRDGDGLFTPFELKCLMKQEPASPYLKKSLPSLPSKFLARRR